LTTRVGRLIAATIAASCVMSTPALAASHHAGTLPDGAVWIADMPDHWNGTVLLFSHGYGPTTPSDSPDQATGQELLDEGYALAGSSYDPKGSEWALNSAVSDQFQTLAAVKRTVLPHAPRRVIAVGQSMGGLISAVEAERSRGRLDGALTTCGLVAGGVNLENYQLDGSWAISALLAPGQDIRLAGYVTPADAALAAEQLQTAAQLAQQTPAGRARLALASAFYNVPTWTTTNLLGQNTNPLAPPVSGPAAPGDYDQQELAQYDTQYAPGSIVLPFIQTGRASIEQSAGGQPSWNAGVDYAAVLRRSPYRQEVAALYEKAGLNLDADLATLTRRAGVEADPRALRKLTRTSVPTGRLQVPALDIHTVADQLIPVQQENLYRQTVRRSGRARLLKQAYVARQGHCNFTSAEIVAALHALERRIDTGRWGSAASADALQSAATALGDAAYVSYAPPALTGVRSRVTR
jgi:dienelactone hydrolase